MTTARVAVVQFPGVNCEAETVRALARVGLSSEVFRWTRPAAQLEAFEAYVLPGGFSYQDRVRAGALAAKDPLLEVLARGADRGKPVLGICNGAQVLVEAGLVPGGGTVELALASNRMTGRSGYNARWSYVRVEPSNCVFTSAIEPGEVLPLPMAHGEGRFTSRSAKTIEALARAGQAPLRYSTASGAAADGFPDNPSGSEQDVAAMSNAAGNVMAIMPHPERAQDLGQLARTVSGPWGERREQLIRSGSSDGLAAQGPGLLLFSSLRRHLERA